MCFVPGLSSGSFPLPKVPSSEEYANDPEVHIQQQQQRMQLLAERSAVALHRVCGWSCRCGT
jgi:hypothetical protein